VDKELPVIGLISRNSMSKAAVKTQIWISFSKELAMALETFSAWGPIVQN
jgi:hypothetical protein